MLSLSFLFSAKGRITRLQYWLSFLLYFGLMIALGVGLAVLGIGGASYSQYMERAHDAENTAQLEDSTVAGDETSLAQALESPVPAPDEGLASMDVMEADKTPPDETSTDPMADASVAATDDALVPAEEGVEVESGSVPLDETVIADEAPLVSDDTRAVTIEPSGGVGGLAVALLGFVLTLALIYSSIVVQIKRWHDQDLPGWMLLINLTGVGTLVTFVMCGFLRGTTGPNKYGADPLAAS